jgi:tetratricopeptide (TPR) repeat protein
VFIAAIVGVVGYANWQDAKTTQARAARRTAPSRGLVPKTTRADLDAQITAMRVRLTEDEDDRDAAILLAESLMRQARVTGNAGLVEDAASALRVVTANNPSDYEAQRMLATVLLSQHKFRDAVRVADRLRRERPDDAWTYGILGDGHLELGEYDEAFAAFQRMMDLKPTAAAYARASYALELQGNLPRAQEAMEMALSATSPRDAEALAWHHAQIGNLLFAQGRVDDAFRRYEAAHYVFRDHPFAVAGLAKVRAARGDLQGAIDLSLEEFARRPTPDVAARLGDLYGVLGRVEDAERYYALAESGWRTDVPEPVYLAAFLAERGRHVSEALKLAEEQAVTRRDVHTMDALSWAYFRAGRVDEAWEASKAARRTGSADRTILYHAAAIAHARGDGTEARVLIDRALGGNEQFDVRAAADARALKADVERMAQVARK